MPGVQLEFQGVLVFPGQVGLGDGQIIAHQDADVTLRHVTEAWSLAGLVDLALLTKAFASTWLCQECSHCISNHFHILMKSYIRFCLYFKIYMLHVALLPPLYFFFVVIISCFLIARV